mgnify:CR=1 FL=1
MRALVTYGSDHRDRDDVRQWASSIGTALSEPGPSTGPSPS